MPGNGFLHPAVQLLPSFSERSPLAAGRMRTGSQPSLHQASRDTCCDGITQDWSREDPGRSSWSGPTTGPDYIQPRKMLSPGVSLRTSASAPGLIDANQSCDDDEDQLARETASSDNELLRSTSRLVLMDQ